MISVGLLPCRLMKRVLEVDDVFYRMRNHPQKITHALDLYYKGASTRKIQEHLGVFYSHNATHKSIHKWIVKYPKIISHDGKKRFFLGILEIANI